MQQGDGRHGAGREERSCHNLQESRILLCPGAAWDLCMNRFTILQDEEDFKTRVLASQV